MIRKNSVLNYDPYNPNKIEAERERTPCKTYTFVSTKNSKTRFCEHCRNRQPFLESEPHVKGWKCRKCR